MTFFPTRRNLTSRLVTSPALFKLSLAKAICLPFSFTRRGSMALLVGLQKFISDMGTLHTPITVWASLYPFPQLLVGGYIAASRSFTGGFHAAAGSPAAWIFAARAISFLIAGQISLRSPLTKLMGPAMHLPFLVTVPLCLRWLASEHSSLDPGTTRFLAYTLPITAISLVLDARTAFLWLSGRNVGKYTRGRDPPPRFILPIPSLLLAIYLAYA